jgi:hypothetical protein
MRVVITAAYVQNRTMASLEQRAIYLAPVASSYKPNTLTRQPRAHRSFTIALSHFKCAHLTARKKVHFAVATL